MASAPIVKSVLPFPTANAYVDFVVVIKVDPNTSNLDAGFDEPMPTKPLALTYSVVAPPNVSTSNTPPVEPLTCNIEVAIVVPIPIPLPLS